jgi:K+-sensing histidine kinase KdpD
MWVITGVVAFPRFGTNIEREMAKRYPDVKVAREDIDKIAKFLQELDALRADVIEKGAKVFPQAFHELRKLNGAVLQHAEKELQERGENSALITIRSAAELMKNNFDILEALSNIEGMKAIPTDATINLYDLVYKMKRIYQERANTKHMQITLSGVRAIIPGSQKSFPIVPAVLIENAIKYGNPDSTILVEVVAMEGRASLTVENATLYPIDTEECFKRGSRFAGGAAEGGGFGLFLAKEIVKAHRGEIKCEFKRGRVRMVVDLPLEKVVV